jgi:hypothetical protein
VQTISSAIHYLPCFGGGFSLFVYWDFCAGGLFFCPSVFHQSPLLSVCYDVSLFVFQFFGAVWFWVLLTVSGDEFCNPLPALIQGVAYCQPALGLPAFPVFVYW